MLRPCIGAFGFPSQLLPTSLQLWNTRVITTVHTQTKAHPASTSHRHPPPCISTVLPISSVCLRVSFRIPDPPQGITAVGCLAARTNFGCVCESLPHGPALSLSLLTATLLGGGEAHVHSMLSCPVLHHAPSGWHAFRLRLLATDAAASVLELGCDGEARIPLFFCYFITFYTYKSW